MTATLLQPPQLHIDVVTGLCEVPAAVREAGGDASVVIDSDDLVTRLAATMAAYCAAVGLPFNPRALTWEPGELYAQRLDVTPSEHAQRP